MTSRIGALPATALGAGTAGIVAAWNGGYYETNWGWIALALFWAAGLALVLSDTAGLSRAEALFAAALVGLLGWTLLSVWWASSADEPVREAERLLVYVAVTMAAPLLVRRGRERALLGGLLVGIGTIASYSLSTRLFPARLGSFDAVSGYRLADPIGYWNALGIFAALGVVLAVGFVARGQAAITRALAGASLVVLSATLYFTFSRGAWIALAVGLLAALALDPRRLRVAAAALAVAPAPLLGVWLASRSAALTRMDRSLEDASEQGRRLAFALLLLALLAAGLAVGVSWLLARISLPARAQRAAVPAIVVLVLIALVSIFVQFGSPVTLAQEAYDEFRAPPARSSDLNERLFTISSRGRYYHYKVAWGMVEEHPALGAGAGSYERYWHRDRPSPGKVRDAHSLYLEVLAELGPVGLGLLLLALGVPLAIAIRMRRHPLVPAAFGAFVAYLVHAGVDWDWEVPAVTLVALLCGAAILVAARSGEEPPFSPRARAGVLALLVPLAAFTVVGLIGNSALAASKRADDRRTAEAEARKAMRWAPWSANALEQLGEVQFEFGDVAAARQSFQWAIAKNPHDWDLWFDLAVASEGKTLRDSVARASRLNPLDLELAALRRALELQSRAARTG